MRTLEFWIDGCWRRKGGVKQGTSTGQRTIRVNGVERVFNYQQWRYVDMTKAPVVDTTPPKKTYGPFAAGDVK